MEFPIVCLVCKTPWLRGRALCDHCISGMLGVREPFIRDERIFKVHSLYSWRRTGPPALAWLVRSLKTHSEIQPWHELAAWLVNAFGPLESSVFVPVPSLGQNHALGLARALSYW